MSSSGLIYAVIVGAWAAYLVPMWLRRQDELNEARPTERFSTAIRLLAGRSAMERRASRALGDDQSTPDRTDGDRTPGDRTSGDPAGRDEHVPDASPTGFGPTAEPAGRTPSRPAPPAGAGLAADRADGDRTDSDRSHFGDADRTDAGLAFDLPAERRARLLARRRRMVSVLFLAFALGAIVAAVAGLAFLWAPAVPAALLTLYIGHLRKLERQRYEVKLDRVRAAQAAERLRQREQRRAEGARDENRPSATGLTGGSCPDRQENRQENRRETGTRRAPHDAAHPTDRGRPHLRIAADPAPHGVRPTAAAALVEATDHEEWVDGMRERGAAGPDSWEPVPVPLPTYVTAPVAPRVSRGLDLGAPGTWSVGRPAEPRNTPLFDQYAEPPAAPAAPEDGYPGRPRAANE